MKKSLFAIAFSSLALISCRNGDEKETLKQLEGNWNWVSTSGGINGTVTTPASTGKTVVLSLRSDKSYEVKENDAVISTGTYTTSDFVSNLDHQTHVYVDFSNDPDRLVQSVSDTKLFMRDDNTDGFTDEYDKLP